MESATSPKSRATTVLVVVTLALAALLIGMILLCSPYFTEPAESTVPPTTEAPTEAPTDPPTEPPTEPEPTDPLVELNPYGIYDFQYEGRYLKLLEGESVTGIDVSVHQGEIDWEQVAASGVDFVMIRLAYRGYGSGKIVDDPNAADNLAGAAKAGLDIGVYFFSQALTVEEAIEEAEYVIDRLDGMELAMPVVYDWEHVSDTEARTADMHDRQLLTDCANAFLGKIGEAGYWPMFYFNTSQSRKLFHLDQLEDYDFWLALYSNRMTFPYKIKMWQYTCTGRVPGIQGNCDINVFFPET